MSLAAVVEEHSLAAAASTDCSWHQQDTIMANQHECKFLCKTVFGLNQPQITDTRNGKPVFPRLQQFFMEL
jgi:hypothetical protein